MDTIVTADLSMFGYKELSDAGKLLTAYVEYGVPFLESGITLNFNTHSGTVFLSDEEYNVGVLEDGKIVQFFICPQCGYEGTQVDALEDGDNHDFEKYEGYCSAKCAKKNGVKLDKEEEKEVSEKSKEHALEIDRRYREWEESLKSEDNKGE